MKKSELSKFLSENGKRGHAAMLAQNSLKKRQKWLKKGWKAMMAKKLKGVHKPPNDA